jgi:hypothetical protein
MSGYASDHFPHNSDPFRPRPPSSRSASAYYDVCCASASQPLSDFGRSPSLSFGSLSHASDPKGYTLFYLSDPIFIGNIGQL